MNVEQLMSRDLKTCSKNETLDCAARIMWESDCGVVPIVDAENFAVGMVTDRDICIAVYTQNKLLNQIPIAAIGMKPVVTVRAQDPAQTAESLMQEHQVRRLAVVDEGGRLVGLLSLNDLARGVRRHPRDLPTDDIAQTLAAISQPRARGAQRATA